MDESKILDELNKISENTSKIKKHTSQLSWWLTVFSIVIAYFFLKSFYQKVTEADYFQKETYEISEYEKEILKSQGILESYKEYLEKNKINNKAFAISESGRWSYVSGRFKEQDAISDALLRCNARVAKNEQECKILNINNALQEISFE